MQLCTDIRTGKLGRREALKTSIAGQSVGALARFYKIATNEVLVVHDEFDLPFGSAKLTNRPAARITAPAAGHR
ncbi:hypothetical protein [Collimonas fungivorans]|uniref:hypothetical protein n=1 Tax=Collimonas fungivorans TaxID=158899 RepID=UPI003FA348CD